MHASIALPVHRVYDYADLRTKGTEQKLSSQQSYPIVITFKLRWFTTPYMQYWSHFFLSLSPSLIR